ncbi:NXPE family member 3-like isoform X1 [Cololabis saira]|uniref:NXPE family member 3-like isoform X1 n=1 Tax=Cololabis saira TaxID=129043 RepID=UPI002AD55832|nr:NXPE family member 3-like isoform X1 [Cololabis saira]
MRSLLIMKGRAWKYTYFLKCGFIILFLASCAFIFLHHHRKFNYKMRTTISPAVSPEPQKHHDFCSIHPRSPQEALEVDYLKDLIAWPETPPVPSPFSLNETSDPAHSTFTILPPRKGQQWRVGDELEVFIKIHDFHGRPKKTGGDVLVARLHNPTLQAGVAGRVVDHHNGSYVAVFSLLWEGSAHVEVTLVHPSEAVTVLHKLTHEQPNRVYFKSLFQSGSITETTTCNVCLNGPQEKLCNYTDLITGDLWFCYKPKKLTCDVRFNHATGGFSQNLKPKEDKLFQSRVNMKVLIPASGPANTPVLPKLKDQPERKSHIVKTAPSGYYYQGVWRALEGTTVRQFNTTMMRQCLKGKVVHLFGDSTIRQWFEYLNSILPDLKEFNLHSPKQTGPFMALDYANNILVTYRCHGPPIRFGNVPVSQLRYIANEIEHVTGGTNTVVVIGIWSHFSTFPVEVYIQRLQGIRKAVVRLLNRAPGTKVIIRTANPKALTLYETLTNSDWYSIQRDKVLRAMFKGVKVHMVDAWEMVLAHHLPHNLHPQPPIVKNMIDVLLSYTCPSKGNFK